MLNLKYAFGFLFTLLGPISAGAAGVAQACLTSDRSPGVSVCTCVQQQADRVLTPRDQRLAISIIEDPEQFRKITSDPSPAAQSFVDRYEAWGALSAELCGG